MRLFSVWDVNNISNKAPLGLVDESTALKVTLQNHSTAEFPFFLANFGISNFHRKILHFSNQISHKLHTGATTTELSARLSHRSGDLLMSQQSVGHQRRRLLLNCISIYRTIIAGRMHMFQQQRWFPDKLTVWGYTKPSYWSLELFFGFIFKYIHEKFA